MPPIGATELLRRIQRDLKQRLSSKKEKASKPEPEKTIPPKPVRGEFFRLLSPPLQLLVLGELNQIALISIPQSMPRHFSVLDRINSKWECEMLHDEVDEMKFIKMNQIRTDRRFFLFQSKFEKMALQKEFEEECISNEVLFLIDYSTKEKRVARLANHLAAFEKERAKVLLGFHHEIYQWAKERRIWEYKLCLNMYLDKSSYVTWSDSNDVIIVVLIEWAFFEDVILRFEIRQSLSNFMNIHEAYYAAVSNSDTDEEELQDDQNDNQNDEDYQSTPDQMGNEKALEKGNGASKDKKKGKELNTEDAVGSVDNLKEVKRDVTGNSKGEPRRNTKKGVIDNGMVSIDSDDIVDWIDTIALEMILAHAGSKTIALKSTSLKPIVTNLRSILHYSPQPHPAQSVPPPTPIQTAPPTVPIQSVPPSVSTQSVPPSASTRRTAVPSATFSGITTPAASGSGAAASTTTFSGIIMPPASKAAVPVLSVAPTRPSPAAFVPSRAIPAATVTPKPDNTFDPIPYVYRPTPPSKKKEASSKRPKRAWGPTPEAT